MIVGAVVVAGAESIVKSKTPTSVVTRTVSGPTTTVTSTVTSTVITNEPAIFKDPRLANLVDSEVTPIDNFYIVDIDSPGFYPAANVSSWSLAVDGLVNSPKKYTTSDIQGLPQSSLYATLECISNPVNGDLISNAKWGGVKLSDLLADVGGVASTAEYVVFYSADGYSVGIPLEKAMMPDSLLAYSMNDQTLPVAHGFPLRSVIPGLYGMMSAKWITRVSVVGSVYEGYWQGMGGWTNDATISTETFITVPESSQASLSENSGSVLVAGYAFAGDRGISKVEVSFDNGETWQPAELKQPLSNLTWTLWAYDWRPPAPGLYGVVSRATDGFGQVQTSTDADTWPNGASGYASKSVKIVS